MSSNRDTIGHYYNRGMTNMPNPTDLMRVSDAVRQTGLRISPYHIVRLIKAGRIPGERVGSIWFVKPADLTAALCHKAKS